MTPPRRALWAAAAVAAVAGAWWFFGRAAAAEGGGAAGWVEVRRDDLVLGVEVTGTLAAVDTAYVRPPQIPDMWNQKIAFLAAEGTVVRRGTPVVKFDSSELDRKLVEKLGEEGKAREELAKRQASLAQATSDDQLHLAEAEARRRKSLLKVDVPADLVSRYDLSRAKAELALAEKEIAYVQERLRFTADRGAAETTALAGKQARAAARVAEIRAQIDSMTVRAPRDGTVVYVADRRGEKRKVGDSVWQGQAIAEIPDLRSMRAEAQIEEADAGRVAVGQVVRLRLDAHPDLLFTGRVETLHGAVEARSENDRQKVVAAALALDRTDPLRMRPGMRFQGTVETGRIPKVLLVPAEAVLATAAGPRVYRKTLFGIEPVAPTLGRRNGKEVEVLAGLAAGDRLARSPGQLLNDREPREPREPRAAGEPKVAGW